MVLKRSGLPEEEAAIAAERALAVYEGYLIFYRIDKDCGDTGEAPKGFKRDLRKTELTETL